MGRTCRPPDYGIMMHLPTGSNGPRVYLLRIHFTSITRFSFGGHFITAVARTTVTPDKIALRWRWGVDFDTLLRRSERSPSGEVRNLVFVEPRHRGRVNFCMKDS